MWWELATDLLSPSTGPKSVELSVERIVEKSTSGTLPVQVAAPGAFTRRLNESGWLADEVIAAITSDYGGPSWYATEFSGTRHGRHVALRMGVIPRIRGNGYNEVHVTAPVAPFRLRVTDGRPAVQEGSSPDVEQLVASLAPASGVAGPADRCG